MRRICVAALTVAAVILLVGPRAIAGDKTDAPSIVVRVKSLQALLQNVQLVVKLVGQEEAANQISGLFKSKVGKNGINGIDPTRPLGAYARYGKEIDAISGAILIPVADEASILSLLDNLGLAYTKDKSGVYTLKTNKNVDVFFRFANRYLYVASVGADSIQLKNLPDPAKALAIPGDATISVLTRMDQIPQAAKMLALGQLDEAIQNARKNGLPNETKAQAGFRNALLDDVHGFAKTVMSDAADLRLDVDVNDQTKEVIVDFAITGQPQSGLSKTIQALGNLKSPLAGMLPAGAAFQGGFHLTAPGNVQKAIANAIQEAAANSVAGIQDAQKKKQAQALFDALMPTARGGEYQVVAAVLGPKDGHYGFLAAIKLKEGLKLGATVSDLVVDAVKQMPAADKGKFQLDFDSVGTVKIHRFEMPHLPAIESFIKDTAGDRNLYVAFRDDALLMALGKDALAALKTALAKTDAVSSSPLFYDVDVARMAPWFAQTPQQKEQASKLLGTESPSRMRVSVTGGASLRLGVRANFNVIEFLVKMSEAKSK